MTKTKLSYVYDAHSNEWKECKLDPNHPSVKLAEAIEYPEITLHHFPEDAWDKLKETNQEFFNDKTINFVVTCN